MAELLQQLDRAAAHLSANRQSGALPTSPIPRRSYSPPPGQDSQERGGNTSMLVAIGIILGCILCGVVLLILAAGTDSKQKIAPAISSQPAAPDRATAAEPAASIQRDSSSTNKKPPVSQRSSTRSGRSRKSDSSKLSSTFVITEPGKTPKMVEPQ